MSIGFTSIGFSAIGSLPSIVTSTSINLEALEPITFIISSNLPEVFSSAPQSISLENLSVKFGVISSLPEILAIPPDTISLDGTNTNNTFIITFNLPEVLLLSTYTIPKIVIPGYLSNSTYITIPIAELPGLTAAKANPISGDWRSILQSIFLLHNHWYKSRRPINWSTTVSSFLLQNRNAEVRKLSNLPLEHNKFLFDFTINYGITKLVDEN